MPIKLGFRSLEHESRKPAIVRLNLIASNGEVLKDSQHFGKLPFIYLGKTGLTFTFNYDPKGRVTLIDCLLDTIKPKIEELLSHLEIEKGPASERIDNCYLIAIPGSDEIPWLAVPECTLHQAVFS